MATRKTWRYGKDKVRPPLHYKQCGLDDIYLCSGYEVRETPHGPAITIKDQDNLHSAIAHHLAVSRKELSGKEIRFLRKRMDLTQSELSRLLGVDSQSVARWEKDECKAPGPADRMLRILYLEFEDEPQSVIGLLKALDETDDPASDKRLFEPTSKGWRAAA